MKNELLLMESGRMMWISEKQRILDHYHWTTFFQCRMPVEELMRKNQRALHPGTIRPEPAISNQDMLISSSRKKT